MRAGQIVADRYELLSWLGEGGAGRVFRGVDRGTGADVAVKLLHSRGPRAVARFVAEAGVLSALGHPHVVRYIAHGWAGQAEPYLVMEWLDGESLDARLERGPLGIEESLSLGRRVADALAAAHARGIVHRDVKPSNLFLAGGAVEAVRVLDFGLAFHLGEAPGSGAAGTPGYMAPEQVSRDWGRVDARADVFALGAVLFRCLTGERPFPGGHPVAVLAQLLLADAPRARALRLDVPPALDALLARLLAREPAERPADGAAVLAALEALGPSGAGVLHSLPPPRPTGDVITVEEQRLLAVIAATSAAPDAAGIVRTAAVEVGARVDRLDSGALLVTLTGASSATDLATRAARCALFLRAALPDAALALSMGQGEADGQLPVGPVVGRVTALLATAGRGAPVPVDDTTHRLLDARFQVRAEGSGRALIRERKSSAGGTAASAAPGPCMGRERELHGLEELLLSTFAGDRGAQAAVVTAAAGMGKTRLRRALIERLLAAEPGLSIWTGRGDSMRAGSPFALAASVLRSAIAPDRLQASAFLGEMLGIAGEPRPEIDAARHHPSRPASEIAGAFLDLVRGACAEGPVLVMLEDLHWADAASIRLFDVVLRDLDAARLAVLALARPEMHEAFPDLWGQRSVQHVRLGPLPRRAAEDLCARILGPGAPPAEVASLIDRAAGNVFYLEELARAYAARGAAELPETVLGVVAARVASLPSAPRVLLRAASVFGVVFPLRGALALLPEGDREEAEARWLPWLIEHEILVRRPSAGGDLQAFRNELLREGAYAVLTERDRAVGHRLAGAFLAAGGAGTVDDAVVGEHFLRGEDWERAFLHFARAGEGAARLHAPTEARRHYGRALEAAQRLGDDALAATVTGRMPA